jgi:hypothetical protein
MFRLPPPFVGVKPMKVAFLTDDGSLVFKPETSEDSQALYTAYTNMVRDLDFWSKSSLRGRVQFATDPGVVKNMKEILKGLGKVSA